MYNLFWAEFILIGYCRRDYWRLIGDIWMLLLDMPFAVIFSRKANRKMRAAEMRTSENCRREDLGMTAGLVPLQVVPLPEPNSVVLAI